MAIDQGGRAVVTREPAIAQDQSTVRTENAPVRSFGPGASEQTRRIVVLVFGLIQILIGARFVLLLLDAREGNALVSDILNVSQMFVAPFDGILHTNSLRAAGSTLDVSAVLAFVGWTIVELIVIWAVGIFRRDRVYTAA